jgi:ABC-type uncharacterized transport system permease subunit
MSQRACAAALVFRVESAGEPFGTMIVQGGVATAWTATASLQEAFTSIAVAWLGSQNPRPGEAVSFTLATSLLAADGRAGETGPPEPSPA